MQREAKVDNSRTETDSMGDVKVPADALYGAQTQRAVENFSLSPRPMPRAFITRLAMIKCAAARTNLVLGLLPKTQADAIANATLKVANGEFAEQFPVSVFQTGSGTSSNMNMNEVLANLAGEGVHPNDHVNMSQSSNDVIPTALQVSAALEIESNLLPALTGAAKVITAKATSLKQVAKTGRTHLMDAMPITFEQELLTWAAQLNEVKARINDLLPRLKALPLGGTAVGTGVNCPPRFPEIAIEQISELTGASFTSAENKFSRMAAQDVALECSSVLKSLAVVLMKIANDLRWMSSGPLAGLAEIELKALQPGSSIMPGKVNPVIPEAVAMAAAEVIGNDSAVTIAAQSGNFQLNVMLPLIADKLLASTELMTHSNTALANTVRDFTVNTQKINQSLQRNPILVTALNQEIGYDAAAAIAKKAYAEGRDILEVAAEATELDKEVLTNLLDPLRLTDPGKH
jgi:fumarate hydratase class II